VDGERNSRWASDGPGADNAPPKQWLKLDLGEIRFLDSINLEWERAYSRDYVIQISDVGTDPVTVDDDGTGIGGDWTNVISPEAKSGHLRLRELNVRARFVRIFSYDGDPNYGISLYEFAIFGDSNGSCEIPPTCPGTLITLGLANASSEQGPNWSADKAIDGDMDTRWSSAFIEGEWFAVDLGAPTLIASVWLFWERAYAVGYVLQTGESLSGPWNPTPFYEIFDADGEVDIICDLAVEAQFVRIVGTEKFSDNYGISLMEFEVRGNQDAECTPILVPVPP
jgi:hypothetical protein